ncbi:uncharacterized protein At1g15400-like [Bidens hawaiensis]|uniref:uncharacterized protein At1g15400-like n=1 Tax=Bidens hawaiensis TaxID=980011 RepID=UPI004049825B
MAGLQRSSVSFRRQGSSGLIWDDKFLSTECTPRSSNVDQVQTASSNTTLRSINTVRRNPSRHGGEVNGKEPSSPRVPVCGLCQVFGKANNNKIRARKDLRKRSIA